jgi:hypothetical protein
MKNTPDRHPLDTPFRHAFAYKGGGGTPATPAPPAAPPTSTQVEVTQAKRDARKQNQQRAGITSTILAGETGGYQDQQKKTLLGG